MYQTRLQSSGREPIFVSSLFRGGSISEPPFFCFAAGTQINLHSLCSSKKRFQSFVEAPGCSLLSRWDVAALVGLPCPLRYAPSPTPLRPEPHSATPRAPLRYAYAPRPPCGGSNGLRPVRPRFAAACPSSPLPPSRRGRRAPASLRGLGASLRGLGASLRGQGSPSTFVNNMITNVYSCLQV